MIKFYLAHNFNDRFTVRKTELRIESKYHIELFNPFYDADRYDVRQLDKLGVTRKQVHERMRKFTIKHCMELVERDLDTIRHCDGLLTIITAPSFGTAMEIIMCAYIYRMPVYIITRNKFIRRHPWLRYMVYISNGEMFNGVRDFEKWLKKNQSITS